MILVAGAVVWGVLRVMPYINSLRAKWETQRVLDQYEKPYLEDKYGGKTPEETYDLFLTALRAGNTNLASKYFVIEKQAEWKKTLEEYKNKNLLTNFVIELENTEKTWKKVDSKDDNFAQYALSPTVVKEKTQVELNGNKIELPAGSYANWNSFQKYPSGVWKIDSL